MTWEFVCNKDEITFSVTFIPSSDSSKEIEVVQPSKEDASGEAVCGVHSAGMAGDYIFKWDNAGNMLQRKITYVLEVMTMDMTALQSMAE